MVEIASARYPSLTFVVADAENFELGETFDFIIVPDVIEHLSEPVAMFRSVRRCCRAGSCVIVTSVNPLWAPVLHLAERLGMKMPEGEHRWLSRKTLDDLARKAGFIANTACGRILCPKEVPLMAGFLNRAVARREVMRPLCLTQVLVLTPCGEDEKIPVDGIAESSAAPTKSETE